MYEKIKETAEWIQQRMPNAPTIAIVLGSGLGELAKRIERLKTFPYKEIPNFAVSTASEVEMDCRNCAGVPCANIVRSLMP